MTFIEATEEKNKLHETSYEYKGDLYQITITPSDPEDFEQYLFGYKTYPITDESAYNYTPKHHYKLRGMWTDGETVKFDDDYILHLG